MKKEQYTMTFSSTEGVMRVAKDYKYYKGSEYRVFSSGAWDAFVPLGIFFGLAALAKFLG